MSQTCSHCGVSFPVILGMVREGPGTENYTLADAIAGSPNTICGREFRAWLHERRQPLKDAYASRH